jgi:hypothetical protein
MIDDGRESAAGTAASMSKANAAPATKNDRAKGDAKVLGVRGVQQRVQSAIDVWEEMDDVDYHPFEGGHMLGSENGAEQVEQPERRPARRNKLYCREKFDIKKLFYLSPVFPLPGYLLNLSEPDT